MAMYEELNMADCRRTACLPFVNGDIAHYRHYAGIPLNPYGGHNVGTVFLFKQKASDGSESAAIHSYMSEIAMHITQHLEQAIEALQGRRTLRFNKGVASLLKMEPDPNFDAGLDDVSEATRTANEQTIISNHPRAFALRVYQLAVSLIHDVFDFDGVRIQELGSTGNFNHNNPDWNGSRIIAQQLGPDVQGPKDNFDVLLERLVELFPQGAVLQIAADSSDIITAADGKSIAMVTDEIVKAQLSSTFPDAEQIVMVPLWDTYHERDIGAVLGFAHDQSRVFLGSSDLSLMYGICTTIMTQVRRLEVKAMNKTKSDFLGSVSHEMRTPIHGVLSSLELLDDTSPSERQHNLVRIARYSGTSLLETVDRMLQISNISSPAQPSTASSSRGASGYFPLQHPTRVNRDHINSIEPGIAGMLHVCEVVIGQVVDKFQLRERLRPQLCGPVGHPSVPLLDPRSVNQDSIVTFDTSVDWSYQLSHVASFEVVFENLLENALKFVNPAGCVVVRLDLEDDSLELSVTNTGKGIAPDFVRHSIFEPFSQEFPSHEGTGLGLSVVKRTLMALGGNVLIDTNEAWGSTFTVLFPLDRMLHTARYEKCRSCSDIPIMADIDLPSLELSLYTPRRWKSGNKVRDHRCTELLFNSLKRNVSRWFNVHATPWKRPIVYPRLLVVLLEDIDSVMATWDRVIDCAKLLVLCPDAKAAASLRTGISMQATAIIGPVTVSALQDAMSRLYPGIVTAAFRERSWKRKIDDGEAVARQVESSLRELMTKTTATESSQPSRGFQQSQLLAPPKFTLADPPFERVHKVPATFTTDDAQVAMQLPVPIQISPALPEEHELLQPRLLLVDDNTINLRVLSLFARKCSTIPSTLVGGGQAAIEAFNTTIDSSSPLHDLIFLDLSMPEVSGFDVARRIRQIEAGLKGGRRVYICAVTGLTSTKDRNEAYACGVDEYLVKPVGLKDLLAVVGRWRERMEFGG